MSQLLIQKYLNDLAKLRQVSGTNRESVVREAFKDLLKEWARVLDLTFVPEYQFETKTKERRYVDGALLHTLRVPFGYWEAKDTKDDLDAEIEKKFRAGYPKTNIIFDDSSEAVLIQHGQEVMRCSVEDTSALENLLNLFFGYERPEIEAFRKAVEQFKIDLPSVLEALRDMISSAYINEPKFQHAAAEFLAHAQGAINPNLMDADVREMLIQHILTGEVFAAVFPGTTYHEDNNVARELHKLETTFFTGNTKFQLLKGLEPYTGVAISLMVRRNKQEGCRIFYSRRPEMETADEKLSFLSHTKLQDIALEEIKPDKKHNWINLANTDFESLLPLATKEAKATKKAIHTTAIFKLFSLGVVTARDGWMYDDNPAHLAKKVRWLIDAYNADVVKLSTVRSDRNLADMLDTSIKWTRAVKNDLRHGRRYAFTPKHIIQALYRPFVKSYLYFDKRLNEMQYKLGSMFRGEPNPTITFLCVFSSNPLAAMAVQQPFDYCLLKMGNGGTQAVSLWYYDKHGNRKENVTDWALNQFQDHYKPDVKKKGGHITREDIFHYVYAVLHDPVYRETYALDLKREFPRIPMYPHFRQWSDWGRR